MPLKIFITFLYLLTVFSVKSQVNYKSNSRINFSPYVQTVPVDAMRQVANYQQQQFYLQQLQAKRKAFVDFWMKIEKINWKKEDSFTSQYSSFLKGGLLRYNSDSNNYLMLQMNENLYLYKNVPSRLWNGLLNSSSKGKYYNNYIRGRYLILSTTL